LFESELVISHALSSELLPFLIGICKTRRIVQVHHRSNKLPIPVDGKFLVVIRQRVRSSNWLLAKSSLVETSLVKSSLRSVGIFQGPDFGPILRIVSPSDLISVLSQIGIAVALDGDSVAFFLESELFPFFLV